jgi:hypothetical protein
MSTSCGNPRRRRRRPPPHFRLLRPRHRRCPRPRSHLLRPRLPRRRPQFRRLLPPRRRLPRQPRLRLPLLCLPRRRRWHPHLHRLPLQARRFQRRVATPGVPHPQSRQRTVMHRRWIVIRGLVAAHRSTTIARALSWTRCRKGSAANPAWGGRVSAASAAATGAVVDTDLPPYPPASRTSCGAGSRTADAVPAFIVQKQNIWPCPILWHRLAPICAGGSFVGRL